MTMIKVFLIMQMIKVLIITTMIKELVIIFLENTKLKIVWIKITTFLKRRVLIAL